jgi:alpha-galactosidase
VLDHQEAAERDGVEAVETHLVGPEIAVVHRVARRPGCHALRCTTEVSNRSDRPVAIESLSSVALGGISPFTDDPAPRLVVHRVRSHWGAEGRVVSEPLERLHLDRPWIPVWWATERYGQVGTTPLSGWGQLVAVEDVVAGVTWAIQLCWGGSWQIELSRRDDAVCVSAGLADYELGHWRVTLAPGGRIVAPEALLTAASGDLDDACARLVASHEPVATDRLASETALPIQFNEYATSWGDPSAERALAIARRLAGSPVHYLVVDCGWFAAPGADWSRTHGDWEADPERFPGGLAAFAEKVRELGLVPGIWMEPETCGDLSTAYGEVDALLRRDGLPLTVGRRRFVDLTAAESAERLASDVAALLRASGMGYVKLDYNASVGLGCDGAESLGEGLRRQVEGTGRFLDALHARAPGIAVELCASGGHRNEPWLASRVDVASSSDAFEVPEIPIVAANTQRLIPARQSLVWCTLRAEDSDPQLAYKLASAFLGRMCLSGDVTELSEAQWSIALDAMALYLRCAPIIGDGRSRRHGTDVASYSQPEGWQAVVRTASSGDGALVVLHCFGGDVPAAVTVPVGDEHWRVADSFPAGASRPAVVPGAIRVGDLESWTARVVVLAGDR